MPLVATQQLGKRFERIALLLFLALLGGLVVRLVVRQRMAVGADHVCMHEGRDEVVVSFYRRSPDRHADAVRDPVHHFEVPRHCGGIDHGGVTEQVPDRSSGGAGCAGIPR